MRAPSAVSGFLNFFGDVLDAKQEPAAAHVADAVEFVA